MHLPVRRVRFLCPLYFPAASCLAGGGYLGVISIAFALLPGCSLWSIWGQEEHAPEFRPVAEAYGKPAAPGQSDADRLKLIFSDQIVWFLAQCLFMWPLRALVILWRMKAHMYAFMALCRDITASGVRNTIADIVLLAWQLV